MVDPSLELDRSVMHIIVAELRHDLSIGALESLQTNARTLRHAPAVHDVSIGTSATHFVVSAELRLSKSLEEFSDSSNHMEFVVHSLGKHITGMWSVDFQFDEEFPTSNKHFPQAKSLTVVAVKGETRLFEWQITQWFEDLRMAIPNGIIASGHTIEERDLHRACALIFLPKETLEARQILSEIIDNLGIPIDSLEIATVSLSQSAS
jgi:hypothetical protein